MWRAAWVWHFGSVTATPELNGQLYCCVPEGHTHCSLVWNIKNMLMREEKSETSWSFTEHVPRRQWDLSGHFAWIVFDYKARKQKYVFVRAVTWAVCNHNVTDRDVCWCVKIIINEVEEKDWGLKEIIKKSITASHLHTAYSKVRN